MHASKDPAIFMAVLEDTVALVGRALAAAGVTLSYRVLAAVGAVLRRHAELGPLLSVLTLQLGPDAVLVLLRVRFPAQMRVGELERLGEQLETDLRDTQPTIRHVVFDMTPQTP